MAEAKRCRQAATLRKPPTTVEDERRVPRGVGLHRAGKARRYGRECEELSLRYVG